LAPDLPLASQEGFIRLVLGWRDFVRHVHEATDGFRCLLGGHPAAVGAPGDGGWSRRVARRWRLLETREDPDDGAAPDRPV
jgi:deoxyribodipyrimidine photolyase-related protein